MSHSQLSELQLNVLEKLAKYKYLTVFQLADLGLAKRLNSIRDAVRKLSAAKRNALIDTLKFPVVAGKGRLPNVAYLKPVGADFLIEHLGYRRDEIRSPKKNAPFFFRDYFHRLAIVDFQIALDQYADRSGGNISLFEADFDYIGSNRTGKVRRESKTKIWIDSSNDEFIIPDAVFVLQPEAGNPVFGLLEVHRGKDTKRSVDQLWHHVRAMEDGAPTEKYDLPVGNRVFCVYEEPATMKATKDRIREDKRFQGFRDRFYFGTLEEIKNHWSDSWQLLKGESVF